MRTVTATPFGRRPVTAGLLAQNAAAHAPATVPNVNKWDVLKALSIAREHYQISDRSLAVLQVLMSFHADSELRDDTPTIIFASNAAICDRAHGMPESTLRRHLAALVQAGLIARHDSPNGKRYARRNGQGEITRAFGFDLRPLLVQAAEIAHHAAEISQKRAELAHLREEVSLMLRDAAKLIEYARATDHDGAWDALDDRTQLARRYMRRKLSLHEVTTMHAAMTQLLTDIRVLIDEPAEENSAAKPVENMDEDTVQNTGETENLSGNPAQNDRHYQKSETDKFDSEKIPLRLVLTACRDILPYASGPMSTWDDLIATMSKVAPMTGIDATGWAEACRLMGHRGAAATLAAIVQRIGDIASPGAYLRCLARKSAEGRFSPIPMLISLEQKAAA